MIVCKFGGTSVQDAEAMTRLAQIISARRKQQPIVVASAMGKTTNHLLEAAQIAAKGKRQEALDFIVETVEALIAERGSDEKIWGSMVKTTMQRRKPGFTESYYGYRSFKELVEDAQRSKLLAVVRDEKSGQYTIRLPAAD